MKCCLLDVKQQSIVCKFISWYKDLSRKITEKNNLGQLTHKIYIGMKPFLLLNMNAANCKSWCNICVKHILCLE